MIDPIGCLYRFTFPNGKLYIGITDNMRRRMIAHLTVARNGSQFPLSRAIRKHGEDGFTREVLVRGRMIYLKELEIAAIKAFGTRGRGGYNVSFGGDTSPMSAPEVAEKVAAKRRGMPLSDVTRQRMSAYHTGRKLSPETRAKMSLGLKGIERTPEWRAKLSAANIGKTLSAETRAKLSAAKKGKPHNWTDEGLRKLRETHIGRKRSADTRAKMSAAAKARCTPEWRAVKSAASKGKAPSLETQAKITATLNRADVKAKMSSSAKNRCTPKWRANMAASLTGRKQSQQHIANANAGRSAAIAAKKRKDRSGG